jgi:large subunit ribosomal protein L30
MAKATTKATANGAGKSAGKMVKITLVRSPIGFDRTQGETVRGMGLRRIRHTVELLDTPETRGMIHKVRHLVTVAE